MVSVVSRLGRWEDTVHLSRRFLCSLTDVPWASVSLQEPRVHRYRIKSGARSNESLRLLD